MSPKTGNGDAKPSPTRITRLRLSNWRNFKEVDLPFRHRMFIVGPNASGKTNFLDAIRFLHEIALPDGKLIRAVESRGGMSHIRSLFARRDPTVTIEIELEIDGQTWGYRLVLRSSGDQPVLVDSETVRHGSEIVTTRPDAADKADVELLKETYLESNRQNAAFRPVAEALRSIEHLHISPQIARRERTAEWDSRDAPGSGFIAEIANLHEKSRRGVLSRIQKLLKFAVPQFSQLKIERDGRGRPHLLAKYEHWRPRGGWQNEQEFSDGTLRLVGLFWAIENGATPLLLEEPELSLHADVVRQLPRLMLRAAGKTGRQFIVNTHSAEMVYDEGVRADEIILLEPTKEETLAVLASSKAPFRAANEAGISMAKLIRGATRPKSIEKLASVIGR